MEDVSLAVNILSFYLIGSGQILTIAVQSSRLPSNYFEWTVSCSGCRELFRRTEGHA